MRLVYIATGTDVKVGDTVCLPSTSGGITSGRVAYFLPPHKPSSTGKVTLTSTAADMGREYYVGVIGAAWIEREDR